MKIIMSPQNTFSSCVCVCVGSPHGRHLLHAQGGGRARGQREEERQARDQQPLQDHGGPVGDRRRQQGQSSRPGPGGGPHLRGGRVHRGHQERRYAAPRTATLTLTVMIVVMLTKLRTLTIVKI